MALHKIGVHFTNVSTLKGGKWFEPFNQASFFNYDTTTSVKINNSITIPPAQTIGGFVYPTVLEISLNTEQVNAEFYTFDFGTSASPNLQVIYTQYNDLKA